MIPNTLGALLAGGRGRRMGGQAKGLIEIDGQPLIQRSYDLLAEVCEAVIVITDQAHVYSPHLPDGCPCVPDLRPGFGAPGGVHTALSLALDRGAASVCVLACDLPRITAEDLRGLHDQLGERAGAFFTAADHVHPLAGWWRPRLLPSLSAALGTGQGLQRLIRQTDAALCPGDPDRLLNLNTPTDLASLRSPPEA